MLLAFGLKHQALAVPEKDVQQVTATAAEDEQQPRERVLIETLSHEPRQTVEPWHMSVAPATSQMLTPASGPIIRAAQFYPPQCREAYVASDANPHAAVYLDLDRTAAGSGGEAVAVGGACVPTESGSEALSRIS